MQRITIGAVLPYSLTANDVQDIEVLRAKGHAVNPHHVGQEVPFVVTKIWDAESGSCNGQLLLDGDCTLWRTSLLPCSDGPEGTKPAPGHFWFQRAAALVFGLLIAALCLAPSLAFAQDTAPASPAPSIWLQVLGGLASLVSVALVPLLGLLTAYLRAKAAESKAARVGIVLNEAAIAAVHELDASLKPQLQAALADGVLTDTEKAKLKATAVELLKTKLPPALLAMAGDLFGAFTDTLVAGKIEQAVAAKNAVQAAGDKPASPPSP